MSIIYFNCRGLGDVKVVDVFRKFLRRVKFNIVFLLEIKLSSWEMDEVKNNLGNYFGVFVDSRGRDRGFVLLWEKD